MKIRDQNALSVGRDTQELVSTKLNVLSVKKWGNVNMIAKRRPQLG